MTTATVAEVVRLRRPRERVSLRRDLLNAIKLELEQVTGLTFPLVQYQRDPVGFAREILGVELVDMEAGTPGLWPRQVEILEAVPKHTRIAVASGHKVSKSHTAAIIGLWFYCCFDDGRVVFSSVTARQVDAILWREVRKMRRKAKVRIPGKMADLARSGFRASDQREMVGFTAREAEAVAGISGANLLYILDEASGIDDAIFEATEGNRAGGARLIMFSNPTRTEGEFFKAFHEKKDDFYHCIQISSEETPNAQTGREIIPGLAGREWIEEKRREWGVDSPLYKVRVQGKFVLHEEGRIVSLHLLNEAEERWHETPAEGRLNIGLDPAGPGGSGDETLFAVRRGRKVLGLYPFRGLTDDGHLVNLLGIMQEHRKPRERPIVKIDREGPIGSAIFGLVRAKAESLRYDLGFEVMGVRSSERAQRQPEIYERVRDELWANVSAWLRDGGAVPEDAKLAKELHAPSWGQAITGRLKVTSKDELRKVLERSPDRADAVCLAVWDPIAHAPETEEKRPAAAAAGRPEIDPYEPDAIHDDDDGRENGGGGVYG